ncbi:redoxin domain-containing protein, partial [Bacillus pumilus]|uniref:redoxin domain-containing protein n=1 Tax=Bacillus pumilus TaxID=1408 RepID=UPI0011A2F5A2
MRSRDFLITIQLPHQLPQIQLTPHNPHKLNLSHFKPKHILLYFYPKHITPRCTTQASHFPH